MRDTVPHPATTHSRTTIDHDFSWNTKRLCVPSGPKQVELRAAAMVEVHFRGAAFMPFQRHNDLVRKPKLVEQERTELTESEWLVTGNRRKNVFIRRSIQVPDSVPSVASCTSPFRNSGFVGEAG